MSLLQSHSSKASILWCSVFFMVQHLYMNTRKNHSFDYTDFCGKMMCLLFNLLSRFAIAFLHGASLELALTLWTSKGKVMSLLFYTLSRFIIDFLPRAKSLLIYKQLLPCLDKVGGFSQQFPHSTRLLAICFFVCVCLLHSFHGLSFLFRCY